MGIKTLAPIDAGIPYYEWQQEAHAGTVGAGHSTNFNNTNVPRQPVGTNGTPMEVHVTPATDCYWQVDAHSLWWTPDAIWSMIRVRLELNRPDADGRQYQVGVDCQMHANAQPWASAENTEIWRLKGGQTYICRLMAVYSTNHNQYHWTGHPHLRMTARTFGHTGSGLLSPITPVVPEAELRQFKPGTAATGTPGGVAVTAGGTALQACDGTPMTISLTPSVNCYWRLKASCIWFHRGTNLWNASGYWTVRTEIRVTHLGLTVAQLGVTDTSLNSGLVDWQGWTTAGVVGAAAGETLEATIVCNTFTHNNCQYWRGSPYLAIWGETFAHGSI